MKIRKICSITLIFMIIFLFTGCNKYVYLNGERVDISEMEGQVIIGDPYDSFGFEKEMNVGLAVITIIVACIFLFFPRQLFYIQNSIWYKEKMEPSNFAVGVYRMIGLLLLLFSFFQIFI